MSTPRGVGRPCKLTPEVAERICALVREGQYLTTAAAVCGVGESTVYRWLGEGEDDNAPERFREFREAVTRARAEAERAMVVAVLLDARGGRVVKEVTRRRPDGTVETEVTRTPSNGRVALEFLARTRPSRWRPVRAVEVSGPEGGPVPVASPDIAALAERLHRHLHSGDSDR